MMKIRPLALFFLAITVLVLLWNISPYINGLGCDFKYTMKSEHLTYTGKCKLGVMTSSSYNNLTGATATGKYLFGMDRENAYFVTLKRKDLPSVPVEPKFYSRDFEHVVSSSDDDFLYVSKYRCVNGQRCFLFSELSIENVFSLDYIGNLAWSYDHGID